MKKQLRNTAILILLAMFVIACSKDNSNDETDSSNSANQATQANQIAQSGTWRISYFWDTDKDETSNFTGYEFSFNSDGTLVATNNTNTVNGTWSVTDSSSSSSSSDVDFNIMFNVPQSSDFEDLNDDWDIVSVTDTMIELTDVSGGNGGTDFLTFVKI
jgi:hypothetical protein